MLELGPIVQLALPNLQTLGKSVKLVRQVLDYILPILNLEYILQLPVVALPLVYRIYQNENLSDDPPDFGLLGLQIPNLVIYWVQKLI